MENNEKLVKVYSNNSKKARLKRRKNKFQRIWDAEKQTYVKVRKTKYPVRQTKEKTAENIEVKIAAIKRRQQTSKKPKSVPVTAIKQKPETKQSAIKQPARIKKPVEKSNVVKIHGIRYNWDSKNLRYKRAA